MAVPACCQRFKLRSVLGLEEPGNSLIVLQKLDYYAKNVLFAKLFLS